VILSPFGTVRERFARDPSALPAHDPELLDLAYLGWEVARAAHGLPIHERRALAALASATLAAMRAGSTRVPLDARLAAALEAVGAASEEASARELVARARANPSARDAEEDAVASVLGRPGDRTPLVIDGEWLYAEKMRVLDERFCARVRERLARGAGVDAKAVARALKAVAAGPPELTEEQKRAVKSALTSPLALVTGGPGTGKTTIVVALLRALAWTGVPMDAVAVAAPTGKAAQRLQQAIDAGLAAAPSLDMAQAALRSIAPAPQTLHRLLGWSPTLERFARHENDPLPHRVVVVDEASMIDLGMMDRLVRAARPEARLVLLGDADQLPSIEAGAVFRDLCASLPTSRLTVNLRVARDPAARRIVAAAEAVNAGQIGAAFAEAAPARASVAALAFEGVESLPAPWDDVEADLLDRWWAERCAGLPDFARRVARVFRLHAAGFDDGDACELRAILEHQARSRVLCVTRLRGGGTSAEDVNDALLARLRAGASPPRRARADLPAGTPVIVQRNDYERGLYNGDQGLVARVDAGRGPALAAVFARRERLDAFPLDASLDLAPAFAMTVHKAQGSEFDHVVLALPGADLPLLTRELVYTAITRARRSVVLAGAPELLARAVARRIERHSGIAERLATPHS
jgi:exodeoxyribonuclease V alpha subunit